MENNKLYSAWDGKLYNNMWFEVCSFYVEIHGCESSEKSTRMALREIFWK